MAISCRAATSAAVWLASTAGVAERRSGRHRSDRQSPRSALRPRRPPDAAPRAANPRAAPATRVQALLSGGGARWGKRAWVGRGYGGYSASKAAAWPWAAAECFWARRLGRRRPRPSSILAAAPPTPPPWYCRPTRDSVTSAPPLSISSRCRPLIHPKPACPTPCRPMQGAVAAAARPALAAAQQRHPSCVLCHAPAAIYCRNDDAFLCSVCDVQMHSASTAVAAHERCSAAALLAPACAPSDSAAASTLPTPTAQQLRCGRSCGAVAVPEGWVCGSSWHGTAKDAGFDTRWAARWQPTGAPPPACASFAAPRPAISRGRPCPTADHLTQARCLH